MKLRKKLTAGLLAAMMAVSTVPAGVSAEWEWSGEEWTEEDTLYSMIYGTSWVGNKMYSDHAEACLSYPIVHIDNRMTELGSLTGDNSLLITADQLKSSEYTDKISLGFTFTFNYELDFTVGQYSQGLLSISSVDGSFSTTTELIELFSTTTGRALYSVALQLNKEDLQSGIVIRLAEKGENDKFVTDVNQMISPQNPLNLRTLEVRNIYNYKKAATLEGVSGDLDAFGSITIPASMLADYPADEEKRPGALLCFEYDLKSDIPLYGSIFLDYRITGETSLLYSIGILYNGSDNNYSLMSLYDDRPKKNGLTVKYGTDAEETVYHGAILKSVSVYLPIGVTYPAESGYQSVGESIAALGTGKIVAQKTSVKDGKYDARFVEKVNTSELSGKSKAVFSLSNGTKTSSVSTNKYYTSLTADGETITAESGTVFLTYTVKDIPENVNVTVTGVTLE